MKNTMIELTNINGNKHWVAARFVVSVQLDSEYPTHSIVALTTGENVEIDSNQVFAVVAQLQAAEV